MTTAEQFLKEQCVHRARGTAMLKLYGKYVCFCTANGLTACDYLTFREATKPYVWKYGNTVVVALECTMKAPTTW